MANGKDNDLSEYYGFGGLKLKAAIDFDVVADKEEIYQIMLGCRKNDYKTDVYKRQVQNIPQSRGALSLPEAG